MTYNFNVRREAPLTEADRPLCVYPLKNFYTTYVDELNYDLEPYYGPGRAGSRYAMYFNVHFIFKMGKFSSENVRSEAEPFSDGFSPF